MIKVERRIELEPTSVMKTKRALKRVRRLFVWSGVLVALHPLGALAQQSADTAAGSPTSAPARESTDNAWWTGPMLSASPNFFFSSRSRLTRWTGDWSSDVCSSD